MDPEPVKRRLTTIFSTDVQGYSRLMADDEAATIRTLTAYKEVISVHIEKHGGRVIDSPGDNLLAEFGSVVHAVESAVEIQQALKEKNEGFPDDRKMKFRIGINVGDVVVEGDRLYGDGVNIAARLESLADGGGICISGDAYNQVHNKLGLGFEDLGEQEVKNISKPVHAYRVLTDPDDAGKLSGKFKRAPKSWRWPALAAVAVVALGGAVMWNFYLRAPQFEPASGKRMTLSLPTKPSIAVLPFANLSGNPEQEYFSDGITEDIITSLAKFPGLFVIARNSTFTYKGKAVKVQRVAEEMGVRYVLEGSVQRADGRVRITAQLIDALKGHHLWAKRYDRPLKDIFALQDEVTEKIVSTLVAQVRKADLSRSKRKGTKDLGAYDFFLRGRELIRANNKRATNQARQLFEKAVGSDPAYAEAYALLSNTYRSAFIRRWEPKASLDRAQELARKAIALDGSLPIGYAMLGSTLIRAGQHEEGIATIKKAISLNPNDAHSYSRLADAVTWAGKPKEAIPLLEKAMRLDPFYPPLWDMFRGRAYLYLRQFEKAIPLLKASVERSPDHWPSRAFLAATYAHMGRKKEAHIEIAAMRRLWPEASVRKVRKQQEAMKDRNILEFYMEGLRKAGLPE